MNRIIHSFQIKVFITLLLVSNLSIAQQSQVQLGKNFTLTLGDSQQSSADDPEIKGLLNYYEKQIYFTQNNGQWRPDVLFKADFPHGQALATKQGMMVGTYNQNDQQANYERGIQEEEAIRGGQSFDAPKINIRGHGWLMKFMNSSPNMSVSSKHAHKDTYNYFMGGNVQTKVANYQEVWYNNVYDNVDVRYYPSEEGTLEYDIVCKPGFNKGLLAIQLEGIQNISINSKGELVLQTSVGEMTYPTPIAYQQIDGKRVSVGAEYIITGKNSFTFKLGNYDPSQTLLIDPIALRWATWITSNSATDDHGHGIWVDPADGAIYVMARFSGTGLITANAFDNSNNGGLDIVLGKYTEPAAIGGAGVRVWQTYIGGALDENPYALDQGPDGNLYLTGYTSSTDFPLSGGTAFGGLSGINHRSETANNIFVLKMNTAGNSIKAAVIGGNGSDNPFDLRLTTAGDVLVCGNTNSTNLLTKYPGSGAVNSTSAVDVIIFKLNQNLSSMIWMKNYGGTGDDVGTIMLNNKVTGEIYVAGYTASNNFPTTIPRQASKVGTTDGFIQKLNSLGTTKWSSYFNGTSSKTTQILCMEFDTARSHLYFGGITDGLNASNTSANGVTYDNTYNSGTRDFFVVRMDTAQTWNGTTYIGGSSDEINMMGLNVDLNNDAYIFGYSNSTNFPMTATPNVPLQSTNFGGYDKVFFKLRYDLDSLLFSTYYGGATDDYDPVGERGIKFSNCRIYTIVTSTSNNIPLTNGALLTAKTGSVYEPGLVVWANPPDLVGNTITGSQTVCQGSTPTDFTGSAPSYSLPTIRRNGTNSTYPSLPSASTYQWQRSSDSTNWVNISGGTNQNLAAALIGPLYQKTYFRRIIGGDACIVAGAADQSIKVKVLSVPGVITNVSCFGFNNGSITATPDGTPSYVYHWNTGATTQTISGLSPASYSVTVTDGSGCSAVGTFSVTQPQAPLSATASSTNATCGNNNGTATANPQGGTSPYTYLWSSGATTITATGLAPILHTVTVTDSKGCTTTASTTVNQATTLDATIVASDVSCFGGNNGSINLTPSGGTPTYHFIWSNGATTEDISGLIANSYSVTITDANQCTKLKTISVGQPNNIVVTETHNDVSCNNGSNGSIDLTVTGGTSPYSYNWSNGATTQDISGLAFGTYSVTVTDAHSCVKPLLSISIGQPADISLSKTQVNNVCFGGNSGSIDLSVSGGSPNYTYLWSNGATTQDISSLTAIAYTVTVTDAHGCTKTLSTTITQPPYIETTGAPAVACESYNLPWNQLVTTTGTYDNHYTSIHGCDSLVHIHVTINHGTHNSITHTACESYTWHEVFRSTSGTYIYNYNNGDGCPSVDTLHLTINYGTHNSSTETACESYSWNGINYTVSGVFTHPYNNADGCPSVDTLLLTINYGTHNSSTETACESYNWHGNDYTVSGVFTYPYNNADGCPSVDTLHLTINYGTHNSSTETACESYNWHGTDYTVSGVFTYPYNNTDGCPSVDTLHLTINYGTHNSSTETGCESYNWHGINYTVSGVFTHPYENGDGCPSVDTLHLTINYGTHNSSTETACESYNWHGTDYTVSGVFTYPYNNADGCPSVDTLHLTINYGTHNSSTETACESYSWNGGVYITSGTYTYNYNNADECPSVDTLHLTINYGTHNSSTETACESYNWHGTDYTVSGVFTYPYNNADGCPSVDTLHLTINYGTHNSSTETACESYNWHGTDYTVSGVFTYPYNNTDGCPSVDTLHLTINYGTHNSSTETACESYNWHGTDYTVSGVFTYPYNNTDGCPSVDTLHLTINYGTHNSSTETACESYSWNGENYTTSGVYTYSYNNADECPSVDTLHLTINYGTHNSSTEIACETYSWNGGVYTTSGTYTYNYNNADECPSVDTLHLTINYGTHNSSTETACESYSWNGGVYTTSGTYTYNYNNADECPSVDTLHLTINYGTHNSSTETACESYSWNGENYTTSGVYTYSYNNADECPSVDTLHLTINYGTHNSSTEIACESYSWNGGVYTTSGTYTYNYNNADECPSVDTLHLTINYGTHNSSTETACESYSWNGGVYTTSGTYTYNYNNADECPSVDTLHLTINYGTHNSSTETACESYSWNGGVYTTSRTYTYNYNNADECPSVDTLHLTINYGTHNSESHTACETYSWNGADYTETGVFTYPYNNQDGCPSVDTLHLTITHGTNNAETHTACESYSWNGINYTVSGTYIHTYENQVECPSVDTLHLTINYGTHNSSTETACESYSWNGGVYTTSGTYTYSYNNADECPSVDTLHLTINYGTHNSSTETACESYSWNGGVYTTSGTYTYNYNNADECPSVDTLHLTINYGTHNSSTETACESYSWNGGVYTTSGTYTYNYNNADECPSVDTLHLTINYGTHNSSTETACESYSWNGGVYTTSGTYTYNYNNADECPSVDTLHLTINYGTHNSSTETACESYSWNGGVYTTSGTYTYNYNNADECPSVDTLHLTINYGTHNAETHTACESFSWNGNNYSATGVYTNPYENSDGCPSVDTLHLTITHGTNNAETHTACESYNWNGINYTESGTYTHSYLTDCPSVDTLHLTIHNGTHNAETHTACESYFWNGILYTNSGIFTYPYENADGCPSVDTLHLTINHGTHNSETHAACESYNWHGTDYTVTGVFTYTYYNQSECPSVDTLHLTINHDVITQLDPVVACNQYQLPWTLALETGNYEHHYTTVNGCDSLVKIHLYISHIEANAVQNGWILCNDGNEGSIDLTASHGIGYYSYNWSNGETTEDISGLSAGTYTVTVTDDTQCTATASVTIEEPAIIEIGAQIQNASCNGNENGWIDLSVIGGTSPYTYIWSNGVTTQDLNNLGAETFYVTVYDANGCSATDYYNVTEPGSADAGDDQTICAGNSVQLTASGGNIYLWTPAASLDNASVYNPVASPTVTTTYTVTISNSSGELVTNGNFEAGNTGFTTDYIYVNTPYSGGYSSGTGLWPEGKYAVGPDPNYYHPLFFGSGYPSGTGNLMIVNGSIIPGTKVWGEVVSVTPNTDYYFSAQISTLVEQSPAELNFSINGSPIGPTLVAPATINNWVQFYAVWNSGANTAANIKIINGNTIASGNDFGLDDISFTTVCSVTDTVVVTVSHIHTEISSTNVHCPGGNDGSANLTVTGGIVPYTYNWSNGETTEDLSGLAAGTYTVTVYDAAQCSSVDFVEITQPAVIVISHTITNSTCGNANGAIDVTITGGTAPYSYNWVSGATTEDLSGIASGDYTLIVTDANGCTATDNAFVSGTPDISLSETHSNATCGQENANVFLTVTGGTAPFDFLWSNGSTNQNLAGVSSGTYLVTVTDINGCPAVLQVDVDCTPPLCNMQLTYDHSNNQCFGECDGTIDLTVIGGTMPFAYNWSNGATGIHLMNLCAGDYNVTVTDVNGCFAIANINISQHDPIVIVMDTSNSNCEQLCHCCTGAIIAFPSGGEGPYSYSWSNNSPFGSIAAGLCPGQYFVTVTDASGCTAVAGAYVDCITIIPPPPPPPPSCQAPTNFTVTNVTSSCATLHWDAVPGAYGYKIRRRPVGTTAWINTGVLAPAHQKTIQNLLCNTAYEWQIETLCNAAQTDVSGWVTNTPNFTTAPYCATPTGLYVDNITATSVRVHWNTVPNATSYRVRYKLHGTAAWTNVGAPATATQKTILNLIAGATYDWQLRANCAGSNDVSSFSNSNIQHFTLLGARLEDDENDNAKSSLSIFPNPANKNVSIELNNGCNCNDIATVTITNVLGQLIYTTSVNLVAGSLKYEINIPPSMIDGIYFVTVRSNEYAETKRLTVNK